MRCSGTGKEREKDSKRDEETIDRKRKMQRDIDIDEQLKEKDRKKI